MAPSRDYASLLATHRVAVLVTRDEEGALHARPMAMRQRVRGEEIWFATSVESKKCQHLAADASCALVFLDPSGGATVTVSGTGEVLRDRKLIRELWDTSWAPWFPGGPDQKDLALLRVIPGRVERHDPETGKCEVLFELERKRR